MVMQKTDLRKAAGRKWVSKPVFKNPKALLRATYILLKMAKHFEPKLRWAVTSGRPVVETLE
jgi:hypothetical protein